MELEQRVEILEEQIKNDRQIGGKILFCGDRFYAPVKLQFKIIFKSKSVIQNYANENLI